MSNHPYLDQGATFSADRAHRFRCWRTWSRERLPLAWLMLNPSTADEAVLDPTLRRVEAFSRREGDGGFEVWNLWSLRATDPRELWAWFRMGATDAHHDANRDAILAEVPRFKRVICAWGAFSGCAKKADRDMARQVSELVMGTLRGRGLELLCLGQTASGEPVHPLYQRADRPLRPLWTRT